MNLPNKKPFVWNNKNALLEVATGLNFLGDRFPELREWYGVDFVFQNNPFSRAAALEERPSTPPSEKIKILVDGEVVETVSERLLKQRNEATQTLKRWEEKMSDAPSWWPEQGDEAHRARIRRSEKILAGVLGTPKAPELV